MGSICSFSASSFSSSARLACRVLLADWCKSSSFFILASSNFFASCSFFLREVMDRERERVLDFACASFDARAGLAFLSAASSCWLICSFSALSFSSSSFFVWISLWVFSCKEASFAILASSCFLASASFFSSAAMDLERAVILDLIWLDSALRLTGGFSSAGADFNCSAISSAWP